MSRYYLHLRDHTDETLDPDGVELPDMNAVKKVVLDSARDVLSDELKTICATGSTRRISGQVVHTLPFKDAFRIIPEAA